MEAPLCLGRESLFKGRSLPHFSAVKRRMGNHTLAEAMYLPSGFSTENRHRLT